MSQKKISRRKIIKSASLLAAASFLASCSDSGTPENPTKTTSSIKKTYDWKLVTTWPKNFPGLGTGAQRLADNIREMSEGRLNIKLFAAGELVQPSKALTL